MADRSQGLAELADPLSPFKTIGWLYMRKHFDGVHKENQETLDLLKQFSGPDPQAREQAFAKLNEKTFLPIDPLGGVGGGGAATPWSMASIKLKPGIKWDLFKKVAAGENPLDLTPKEWGKHVAQLGPDSRTKNAELTGAQFIDEHGSDPAEAIRRRLLGSGVPEERLPSYGEYRLNPNLFGFYDTFRNGIAMNKLERMRATQHPEAYFMGGAGHEAQHATDWLLDPVSQSNDATTRLAARSMYRDEFVPPEVKSNRMLGEHGLFQPHRMEALFKYAITDPDTFMRLPPFVQEAMAKGYSPEVIASAVHQRKAMQSSMGETYRIITGNRGFRGTDPYLADILHTTGHFAPGIKGEMEIPVKYLAEQQARLGGDVGPWDNVWSHLKTLQSEHKSPIRPFKIPQQPATKVAINPWAIGVGLGSAGAGAAVYYKSKKVSNPKPEVSSDNADQDILRPNPRPNQLSRKDQEFWDTVERLRRSLRKR